MLWCRSGEVIPSVRRETQQPAESVVATWFIAWQTAYSSIQVIGDWPEPSVLLANNKRLPRAQLLLRPKPRCDYLESVRLSV